MSYGLVTRDLPEIRTLYILGVSNFFEEWTSKVSLHGGSDGPTVPEVHAEKVATRMEVRAIALGGAAE